MNIIKELKENFIIIGPVKGFILKKNKERGNLGYKNTDSIKPKSVIYVNKNQ